MSSDLIAAENLAQAIRQVAKRARSEEDLRVGVEHTLGATLQALGLTATPEYEKITLSGSASAYVAHVLSELGAVETLPALRRAYDEDKIDLKVMTWDDVTIEMERE